MSKHQNTTSMKTKADWPAPASRLRYPLVLDRQGRLATITDDCDAIRQLLVMVRDHGPGDFVFEALADPCDVEGVQDDPPRLRLLASSIATLLRAVG